MAGERIMRFQTRSRFCDENVQVDDRVRDEDALIDEIAAEQDIDRVLRRYKDIHAMVLDGYTVHDIADEMAIKYDLVHSILTVIYKSLTVKWGCTDRVRKL